jgi:integrase
MPGQIISRGKNKWLCRIFNGRNEQGKREYVNKTIHGPRKVAEKYVRQTLTERDQGTLAVSKLTITTLLDDLLLDYKNNNKSYDWAQIVVNHLRPVFGNVPVNKLTTDHLQRYIAHRKANDIAAGTINREIALLRRSLNLGAQATPPKVTRMPRFMKLAESAPRAGFFELDEYKLIRDALPEYLRPVLAFGFFTGARKEEILSLRWSQVDLPERVVRLNPGETKNDEGRLIPLTGELYEILTIQKQTRDQNFPDCPWVFSRDGQRIVSFYGAWETACEAVGLWDATKERKTKKQTTKKPTGGPTKLLHDLRRTGVRNLVRAGVPERVAMTISGHKTRSVFDRYNIVSEADLKDAARRLGEYLNQKAPKVAETVPEDRHTIGTQDASAAVQ